MGGMTEMARLRTEESSSGDKLTGGGGRKMHYYVNENPPWYYAIVLGFQHYLTMFGATIAIPFILSDALGVTELKDKARLIQTIFFCSGLCTLLQGLFGLRLPVVQGGTFSFLAPAMAIANLPVFADAGWRPKLLEIQGAIMVAALFEVIMGATGLVGILLRFVGPLTIAPTITMIGVSLSEAAVLQSSGNPGIAFMVVVLLIVFSQSAWLGKIKLRVGNAELPVVHLFPVLLGILISWGVCAILTATDTLREGDAARTDGNLAVLKTVPWFYFPYPGQWGTPTVSVAGVFGMLAGVLAGMIESIGDYYAIARLADAPPPPKTAVNRGILFEGIGCIIAGAWGSGNGTTTYSENNGAVGLTRVASRTVVLSGACIMLLFGIIGKFGGIFATIPGPIVGGVYCVMFGMIVGVGISNLQYCDLKSARNLFVVGFSILMALVIPDYVDKNPKKFDTGVAELTQIITVLLSTNMAVAGIIACLLDNILPGTDEERGITALHGGGAGARAASEEEVAKTYNPIGIEAIYRVFPAFVRWCPFLPVPYHGKGDDTDKNGGLSISPTEPDTNDLSSKV